MEPDSLSQRAAPWGFRNVNISRITSLSAHYGSDQHTFQAILQSKLMGPRRLKQRLEPAPNMVLRCLSTGERGGGCTDARLM